ncbi:hypothetical protein [Haloferax profundi]|uniref:hypothetical protein n=1 Tax=Haloferax profundi TaxID=1544718 RepID=UPI0018D23EE5|nr:hypothetical protein [Haloferax profundi]
MNSTPVHAHRIATIGRVVAALVAVGAVVFTAQTILSWLAPVVATPLLVTSWVLGLGIAIFLPFAIVAVVARVVRRLCLHAIQLNPKRAYRYLCVPAMHPRPPIPGPRTRSPSSPTRHG